VILCPVGGGGQLSGIAVAAKSLKPGIRVIGVEPAGADDAARSLKAGHIVPVVEPRTIADGLKTSLGEKPFAEIIRLVDDIVTVREDSIVQAMRLIWEVMKLIVEPSGAVAYAAITEGRLAAGRGSGAARIGIVLSGGNLDLDRLPWQPAGP
jgi:threonine dehydratase